MEIKNKRKLDRNFDDLDLIYSDINIISTQNVQNQYKSLILTAAHKMKCHAHQIINSFLYDPSCTHTIKKNF